MNDLEWEQYIRGFCDKHGQNFETNLYVDEKFVQVSSLMDFIQKESRKEVK